MLAHAADPAVLDGLFLDSLRAEVFQNHPVSVKKEAVTRAANQEVEAVRRWEDPMAGVRFMAASQMMRMDDGDVMLSLMQNLPKSGLYDSRRKQAEAKAGVAAEKAQNDLHIAASEAVKAAIELALADESLALEQEQIRWLNRILANARQKAMDPAGSGTETLRMETELAKEEQALASLKRNREGLAQALNLALGRAPATAWQELRLPDNPAPIPTLDDMTKQLEEQNPEMRGLARMIEATRAESAMARRERRPEIGLGVDAQIASETGELRSTTVGVQFSLPWLHEGAYQARIRAAKSLEDAAKQDREALRRVLSQKLTRAHTEATNMAAEAESFAGEIHTKARQAMDVTESAWISSKASLTDILDSARTLFSIRLEQRRKIAAQLMALEDIHTLIPKR